MTGQGADPAALNPGELATLTTRGLDALDDYVARYLPQLVLATLVPITVLVVVLDADWISALITLSFSLSFAAMIFAGQALYGSETPENVCISLLCHGALYFCGFVLVSKERYVPQESGKLLLGLGYVVLRAAVLRPLVAGREHMLIYILMDGLAVQRLLPESVWPVALPVYHALLAAFLFLAASP